MPISNLSTGGSPAGTGSELQYRNAGAFGAVTGSSVSGGAITLSDTLTSSLGSIASSKPARSDTATWTGGGLYTHEVTNITNTSSNVGSLLREWQVDGAQVVAIRRDGSLQWQSASNRIIFQSNQIFFDIGGLTRAKIGSAGVAASQFDIGGVADIYVGRNVAGVAEFNNGTPGTLRDAKLRSLISSGGTITLSNYTVATLPTAASNTHAIVAVTDGNASPTYRGAVTGGGSTAGVVYCTGASWIWH